MILEQNNPSNNISSSSEYGASHSTHQSNLPDLDLSPVSELPYVSVRSNSQFMNDLKRIEAILDNLPLMLNPDNAYVVFFDRNDRLVIAGDSTGITEFSLIPGSTNILGLQSTREGQLLELEVEGNRQLVLISSKSSTYHSDYSSGSSYRDPVARTTSPWRSYDHSSSYDEPSESAGGGSGER